MRSLYLFLAGAIFGPLLDGIHVYTGTLAYENPDVGVLAWWTPPLFGAAMLAITRGLLATDSLLRRPSRAQSWREVAIGLAIFIGVYFLSGFWNVGNVAKTATFAGAALAAWYGLDKTWQGLVEMALVAIGGCFVESTLVHYGTFHYNAPDFANIPYWLAPLYLNAALAIGNLARKTK